MGKAELKIEIDAKLLERARSADIQMAVLFERMLRAELDPGGVSERAARWASESAESIKAHNQFVEENGAFGSEWRSW